MLPKIFRFRLDQSVLLNLNLTRLCIQKMSERNIASAGGRALFEHLSPVKPPGQPPKVWDVIEKKTKDGRPLKFTIQEIPKDRYEDAIRHMCAYFLVDEPTCQCSDAVNDPIFVQDSGIIWSQILKQDISIGAFIDNPDGGKPIIAGLNMLGVETKDKQGTIDDLQLKSQNLKKICSVMIDLTKKAQVYERYGVDKYMFAFGLSVLPDYRGYGLGTYLLKTREKIGREYNIPMTSTVFTSMISAKAAQNAGFELLLEKNFVDIVFEDGKEYFPGIKSKTIKIMARRLS